MVAALTPAQRSCGGVGGVGCDHHVLDRRRRPAGLAAQRGAGRGRRVDLDARDHRQGDRRRGHAPGADAVLHRRGEVEQLVGPGGLVAARGVHGHPHAGAGPEHVTEGRDEDAGLRPTAGGQGRHVPLAAELARDGARWRSARGRGSWPEGGPTGRASPCRRAGPPTARPRGRRRTPSTAPTGRRWPCRASWWSTPGARSRRRRAHPARPAPTGSPGAPSRCRSCSRASRWWGRPRGRGGARPRRWCRSPRTIAGIRRRAATSVERPRRDRATTGRGARTRRRAARARRRRRSRR